MEDEIVILQLLQVIFGTFAFRTNNLTFPTKALHLEILLVLHFMTQLVAIMLNPINIFRIYRNFKYWPLLS